MINLTKVKRLLYTRLRMQWRAARADLLPLTMAPLLLGGLYYACSDIATNAYSKLLARLSFETLDRHLLYGIFCCAVLLFLAALPNLIKEIFSRAPDDQYLLTLPVRRSERFLVILIWRALRNIIPGLLIGFLIYQLATDLAQSSHTPRGHIGLLPPILAGLLFVAILSPLEVVGVLALGRWRALTWQRYSGMVGAALIAFYLMHRMDWDLLNPLLYPFWPLRWLIAQRKVSLLGCALLSIVTAFLLAVLAGRLFKSAFDIPLPTVERLLRLDQRFLNTLFRLIPRRWLHPAVAALIKRDLILTLRVFHRGILFNLAVAFSFLGVLSYLILRYPPVAGPYLFITSAAACVMGAFSIALIAAQLLKYQIEFLWIDQSSHLDAESFWLSKVLFTNIISVLAMPVLTALTVAIFARPPRAELNSIFLISLLATIQVASFTGSLVYEFERHPQLALVFCFMASVPLPILIIVALPWWVIVFIFPVAMHYLKSRGVVRVRNILKYG